MASDIASPGCSHCVELELDVWNDLSRGVGRGGSANVGDEVEQGGVLLVADGADHRRCRVRDGPDQRLFGERKQVFDRAATTRDDDDIDGTIGVELLESCGDLGRCGRPLNRDLAGVEGDSRPSALRVLDDVAFGGGGAPADEANPAGQEGQRLLAVGGEQALGGQRRLESLEPGEQLTEPDMTDLRGRQRERPPGRIERGLGEDDDAVALGDRRLARRRGRAWNRSP